MATIFVGLPAYNEEIAIERLLYKFEVLIRQGLPLHLIVYNDGSSDRTGDIAKDWSSRIPLTLLGLTKNKGLGTALRNLVSYACSTGAAEDILIIMDCDDTHDPMQIESMVHR